MDQGVKHLRFFFFFFFSFAVENLKDYSPEHKTIIFQNFWLIFYQAREF